MTIQRHVARGLASRLRLKQRTDRAAHPRTTSRQRIGFSPEIETPIAGRVPCRLFRIARGLASRLRLKLGGHMTQTPRSARRQRIGFSPEIETHLQPEPQPRVLWS